MNGTPEKTPSGELVPRQRLSLREAQSLNPPPTGIGLWAEKLRTAAYGAVKESDVEEIVKAQVDKAKAGDPAAVKFVTGFLLAAPKVTVQKVVVRKGRRKANESPATTARSQASLPGPPAKPDEPDAPPPPSAEELAKFNELPTVKMMRRLAGLFLLAHGSAGATAISQQLDTPIASVASIMKHEWFELADKAWKLTPAGRQAVG